jgi:hypothetical protein
MWPALAIMVAGASAASAIALAAQRPAPAIRLGTIAGQRVRPGYSETVRQGQLVAVSGTVTHLSAHGRIELQGRLTAGWHTLLRVPLKDDAFTLHWHVRGRDFQLRAVLLSDAGRVATSAVAPILVGSAIVRCRPAPAPTHLPAGDGWISGGVHLLGGPAPGIDQCQSSPSTVIATSAAGNRAASLSLRGGDGYSLVLPAGSYRLRDGQCRGTATVIAGRRTVADTDCDFP